MARPLHALPFRGLPTASKRRPGRSPYAFYPYPIPCRLPLTPYPIPRTLESGRAKRGGSGALYSQSALARLNSSRRSVLGRLWPGIVVLRVGSHAADTCESRQVRKEAAVSSGLRVPWVSLA